MRASLLVPLLLSLPGACSRPEASGVTADSLLRLELVARAERDQQLRLRWAEVLQHGRSPDSAQWVELRSTDSANTVWLKAVVGQHGWPRRSRVGSQAAEAALLLLQHAVDSGFRRRTLILVQDAFTAGEVDGPAMAELLDRVAVESGQPQRYGTQADLIDGRVVLSPLLDSATVDERRAAVGLMPLADYLHFLDSMSTARSPP